jgi:hypothetical protein
MFPTPKRLYQGLVLCVLCSVSITQARDYLVMSADISHNGVRKMKTPKGYNYALAGKSVAEQIRNRNIA